MAKCQWLVYNNQPNTEILLSQNNWHINQELDHEFGLDNCENHLLQFVSQPIHTLFLIVLETECLLHQLHRQHHRLLQSYQTQ